MRPILLPVFRACLACLAGSALAWPATAQSGAPTEADWRRDLDQLIRDVQVTHPDPFGKTGRLAWLREAADIEAALPGLTDEQRMVRAMRLVAALGDGHTQLAPSRPAFAWWYGVRFYEFSDGLFVVTAHQSVADLAGAKVLQIGGRPATEALRDARALMGADNVSGGRENLFALHSAALMRGLGYANASRALPMPTAPQTPPANHQAPLVLAPSC